jgi:hypothetical protein
MRRQAIAVFATVAAVTGVAGAGGLAQAAHPAQAHWRVRTLPVRGKSYSYAEPGVTVGPHRHTLIVDAASANTGAPPTFWISRDGGRHWSTGRDFDTTGLATGDADAVIGPDGYMYALNLGYSSDPHKAANPRVLVFRSRNGRSWSGPAPLPTHGLDQPDRPWLVVNPRRPANVDMFQSEGGGNIFMWRSRDHGATFTGPTPVSGGRNDEAAVALSSRPLFDPTRAGRMFMLYETLGSAKLPPPRGRLYEIPLTQIWLATSTDAGRTWKNRRVLDSSHLTGALKKATVGHALITSAIDGHGDLYAAFSARPRGRTRTTVYLMHSVNHGRSWSRPAAIPSPTASNVMPALAATGRGIAYLSWYGSANDDFSRPHAAWREMFASTRDALSLHPRFSISRVSGRRPVHVGGIDTAGALGDDTGANWGLRDFQSIAVGPCGAPELTWAVDNGVMATQTATRAPACR